jgi:hypothetical protein
MGHSLRVSLSNKPGARYLWPRFYFHALAQDDAARRFVDLGCGNGAPPIGRSEVGSGHYLKGDDDRRRDYGHMVTVVVGCSSAPNGKTALRYYRACADYQRRQGQNGALPQCHFMCDPNLRRKCREM